MSIIISFWILHAKIFLQFFYTDFEGVQFQRHIDYFLPSNEVVMEWVSPLIIQQVWNAYTLGDKEIVLNKVAGYPSMFCT